MKKKVVVLSASLLLCAVLAACGTDEYMKDTSTEVQAVESGAEQGETEQEETEEDLPEDKNPGTEMIPPVAGAALYRGVVTNIDDSEDGLVITLEQVEGTNFGHSTLQVMVTSNTSTNLHINEIANDNYVEVYYGAPLGTDVPEQVDAIMINLLPDADLSIFNGVVESHTPDEEEEGAGSFLLTRDDGYSILFRYGEGTQLYLNGFNPGEKLNVYFDGITTRSIPPQANAIEVRPFAEAQ